MLNTLKANTPGDDELPMYGYTKNFSVLGSILLEICNKNFYQGKFPAELKTSKVVPIYKNGDKVFVGN